MRCWTWKTSTQQSSYWEWWWNGQNSGNIQVHKQLFISPIAYNNCHELRGTRFLGKGVHSTWGKRSVMLRPDPCLDAVPLSWREPVLSETGLRFTGDHHQRLASGRGRSALNVEAESRQVPNLASCFQIFLLVAQFWIAFLQVPKDLWLPQLSFLSLPQLRLVSLLTTSSGYWTSFSALLSTTLHNWSHAFYQKQLPALSL